MLIFYCLLMFDRITPGLSHVHISHGFFCPAQIKNYASVRPFSTEEGVTRTTRIVFRKFQLYFIELLFSTWICKLTCLNVNHITYDVGRNDGLNFNPARGIYTLNLLSILPTNTAVSPRFFYETSLAARSEESRLYSQVIYFPQHAFREWTVGVTAVQIK